MIKITCSCFNFIPSFRRRLDINSTKIDYPDHPIMSNPITIQRQFPRLLSSRWASASSVLQSASPQISSNLNAKERSRYRSPSTTSLRLQCIFSKQSQTHGVRDSNMKTLRQSRRAFSSTPARMRDHHFDTLKFAQRLKDEGFTEEQAVAMMKVLSDVIEER